MGALGDYIYTKHVPGCMKRSWGGALWSTYCLLADVCSDMHFRAAQAGLIASPISPDDVLGLVGKERGGMFIYPTETYARFRARLLIARETWDEAGFQTAIIGQLAAAGFAGATIETKPDRTGPKGEAAPYRSQFYVRFPPGLVLGGGAKWGEFTWGDGTLWGANLLSLTQLHTIFAIINKFRDAQSICRALVFEIEGEPDYEVELPH